MDKNKSCLRRFLRNYALKIVLLLLSLLAASFLFIKVLTTLLVERLLPSSLTTLSSQPQMITQKLINLASAMAEYEGWEPISHQLALNQGPTVAYRNHNPGNMRTSPFSIGTRDGFAVFFNDATGFFAMCADIMNKALGKTSTGLNGNSTIRELIAKWSAGTPEAVERYTAFVCSRTGLTPDTKLETLIK